MVRRRLLVACAVLGAATAHADTTFAPGSIIIPASATYQTDCGAVAMYGLVYDILRANAWLEANRATACPGLPSNVTCKIELYYAYREGKASPNRCTPTDKHLGPSYSGSGTITHDHPRWNDGCDFEVGYDNLAVAPVMAVVPATATDPSTDALITTISTSSKTDVYPRWSSKQIKHSSTASADVDVVRYWGGSFIVDDADAITLRKLIKSGSGALIARDSANNVIDFSPFRQASCSFGSTVGGGVALHRAMVEFTAPTPRVFTAAPPRIALLAKNSGSAYAKTGRVDDGILQRYLARAGLSFAGAQGCPPGGYHASNGTVCPNGGTPGQIYDLFDFVDLTNGKLEATSGGEPVYRMLWAPHWEFQKTAADTDGPPTTNERTVIDNLASYLDGQNGLMAECASIETMEGQRDSSSNVTQGVPSGQFQTCVADNGGACSTSTTLHGIKKNSGNGDYSNPVGRLYNCTEPTTVVSSGGDCAFFGAPGDPFVQIADWRWDTNDGKVSRVADFLPNTGSMYRPGVRSLISGVTSLDKSKLGSASAARTMITGDFVTRSNKDNDTAKSNILYLAGHDLTGTVPGTKVVLQTLLQLGDPPVVSTTKEVTRATAIAYPVNGTPALIQGTFEKISPPPTAPTVTQDADAAAFRFPHVLGHLRTIAASSVGTAQTDFSQIAPMFDAADKLPAASYAGCGANAFTGSCRTVFTNTAGGVRPDRVLVQQSNVSTIGPLLAAGTALNSTTQATLVQRILAGQPDPDNPNSFRPRLGGVDRSTVAIIPPSAATNPARPTMIYFGGLDGMLHAVCAGLAANSPCKTAADLGKEVWAFLPRTQLARVRKNTARIDGSPRVVEMFGDFTGTGARSIRTILMFHTGSGNANVAGEAPAVYALDITDPADPQILWEVAGGSAQAFELGVGLTVTAGRVQRAGATRLLAFVQTQNGGVGGTGSVLTAIDIEAGAPVWQWGHAYPAPRVAASGSVPATGIPGGAIAIDRLGTGYATDVVFGTLYGDLWQLDAGTGQGRHDDKPLFRFSVDKRPFGTAPSVMSSGGRLHAIAVSGGYADTSATVLWSGTQHQAVAVALDAPASAAPLSQTSVSPYLTWVFDLGANERAFAQPAIIGGQLLLTSDATDVNQSGFGDAASGKLYRLDVTTGNAVTAAIAIGGGAGGVAGFGTQLYAASGKSAQEIGAGADPDGGETVTTTAPAKVTRRLWLRTR